MKKILALALALLLAIGMVAALAEPDAQNTTAPDYTGKINQAASFDKKYTISNGTSPEETFTFKFTFEGYKANSNVSAFSTPEGLNAPDLANVTTHFNALKTTTSQSVPVTLNEDAFPQVGIYKYKVEEVAPNPKTAGVTYNTKPLYLIVTILHDTTETTRNVKQYVAAVHYETEDGQKQGFIENKYESGKLTVTKRIEGNIADYTAKFPFTVTLTPAEGEAINSTIDATAAGNAIDGSKDGSTGVITYTFELGQGDSAVFINIPEGVTYEITETELNGYTQSIDGNASGTIADGGEVTVTYTNKLETDVDTGITLDTLPYTLLLAAVVVGAVLLMARKRRSQED